MQTDPQVGVATIGIIILIVTATLVVFQQILQEALTEILLIWGRPTRLAQACLLLRILIGVFLRRRVGAITRRRVALAAEVRAG